MPTTYLVIIGFFYFAMCGMTTALFHKKKMYIGDGPHILFAVMCWPIVIPCYLGYVIPSYFIKRFVKE